LVRPQADGTPRHATGREVRSAVANIRPDQHPTDHLELPVPSAADATISALRSGHDDLAGVVRGLSADDLAARSVATEWDVSQVLSHLGSGAVIGLAALEASLDGKPNPGMDFNKSVWARWDAMSAQDRAAGFLESNETLVARYEGLDDATRDGLRVDLGFLPEPIPVVVAGGFRLSEFALHSWDVRASFDPTATVRPEAYRLLLDGIGMRLGWIARSEALDGRTATLHVTTTDPERSFGLTIADGVSLGEAPEAADGTLTLPAEAWLRLVSGRLRPEHTPAGVEATGAVDLDALRRVFPGY
jgi:uncharacterized protein (TIGR03083 family)